MTVLTSGCVNVVSIDAEDSVEFGTFEVSIPLDRDSGTHLRLRGSRADGEFDQTLDSDERIQVGDARIGGAAEVEGAIDLSYYSVAIGSGAVNPGMLAGESRQSYYLGVARTEFDLTLEAADRRFDTRGDSTELYMQYGFHHAFADTLEFGFDWAISFGRDFSGISEIDLSLDYRLMRQLYLSGGYRWLEYVNAQEDEDSNLEVDFRGPFIGLKLAF